MSQQVTLKRDYSDWVFISPHTDEQAIARLGELLRDGVCNRRFAAIKYELAKSGKAEPNDIAWIHRIVIDHEPKAINVIPNTPTRQQTNGSVADPAKGTEHFVRGGAFKTMKFGEEIHTFATVYQREPNKVACYVEVFPAEHAAHNNNRVLKVMRLLEDGIKYRAMHQPAKAAEHTCCNRECSNFGNRCGPKCPDCGTEAPTDEQVCKAYAQAVKADDAPAGIADVAEMRLALIAVGYLN